MSDFKVYQLAFVKENAPRTDIPVRVVTVDEDELEENPGTANQLDLIFRYGQNDFQPQDTYSVSTGDIIDYYGDYYLVQNVGFRGLTTAEFESEKAKYFERVTDWRNPRVLTE